MTYRMLHDVPAGEVRLCNTCALHGWSAMCSTPKCYLCKTDTDAMDSAVLTLRRVLRRPLILSSEHSKHLAAVVIYSLSMSYSNAHGVRLVGGLSYRS